MATLHIVNRTSALERCLSVAAPDDSVLLIEDGVKAAATDSGRPIIALREDLDARNVTVNRPDTVIVDYSGFVDLVASHQPIVSWR